MPHSSLAVLAACALLSTAAHAFKLQPWGPSPPQHSMAGADRQARAFMRQFTVDIHERITRQAYEIAGVKLTDDVIAGVRWNDNPPAIRASALFGGCSGPKMQGAEGIACWASMMRVDRMAWEAITRREKALAPMRSHFGDMQFLHAMAARAGESPEETRQKMLRWSEFAYRIARGEIEPRANVFQLHRARSPLDAGTAKWVSDLFRGPSKQLWTVQDMFLAKAESLRPMAFGSLLHLVEDSYSAAHVRRESKRLQANGCLSYDGLDPIVQFQTYVGQDAEKHGVCDDAPDWLEAPRAGSPAEVIAEIVRAYQANAEWPVVKAILEDRAFRLSAPAAAARPGRCFELLLDATQMKTEERIVTIDPSCLAP